MSNPKAQAMVAAAVGSTISRKQAMQLGQAAADRFGEKVRSGRDYAGLLARLWDHAEGCLADLDARNLETKEKAQILATVARVLPQLQAAEQSFRLSIGERSVASLTGRELKALVQAIDQNERA